MTDDRSDHLEGWHPHEPELSQAQIQWMRDNIPSGRSMLDLGCGTGRVLVPMSEHGLLCTGLDQDRNALEQCREGLTDAGASADLIQADITNWLMESDSEWDVISCLGNTFCLFWNIEEALKLLQEVRRHLSPGGLFVLDDIPGDLWPELIEGRWQEGLDPEDGRQLVWSNDDAIFTIRHGSCVDPDDWNIGPQDVPMRLWTAGALSLAALSSGFEVPVVPAGSGVRVLRPVSEGECTS